MAKRIKKQVIQVKGSRVGTKRSDFRWLDADGTVWASKFEYTVYKALKDAGVNVRKTTEEDSVPYQSTFTHAYCAGCQSTNVVQDRTFTPDLFVVLQAQPGRSELHGQGYSAEVKGYLRADRRKLLRDLRRAKPLHDLRFIIERDYKVTAKLSLSQWITKYLKCPVITWKGIESVPSDWR